jgi:hypothetical protein
MMVCKLFCSVIIQCFALGTEAAALRKRSIQAQHLRRLRGKEQTPEGHGLVCYVEQATA